MEVEDLKNGIENATMAVATVDSSNKPHCIAIMYAKVRSGKIIITNNYMKTTIQNLKENPYVSLVFWAGEKGWRINGKAKHFDSGEWADFVKNMPENKDEPANGALVVEIESITELG